MTGCLIKYTCNTPQIMQRFLTKEQLTKPVNIPMAAVTIHLTTSCPRSDCHIKQKKKHFKSHDMKFTNSDWLSMLQCLVKITGVSLNVIVEPPEYNLIVSSAFFPLHKPNTTTFA